MNKERIKYAISIMEQAQNLNMAYWQGEEGFSTTIEDLHTCGNTACFAGYIALSPLFQAEGGRVGRASGAPSINGKYGEDAILDFFEMPNWYKPFIHALVLGVIDSLDIGIPIEDQEETSRKYFSKQLVEQINKLVHYTKWCHWEPKQVVTVLQALLEGEFDWLEGYTK